MIENKKTQENKGTLLESRHIYKNSYSNIEYFTIY